MKWQSLLSISLFLIAGMTGPAWSQAIDSFPARPLTLVVPYAAGGPADLETRLYASKLNLGQPELVDYKPGAGATVGTA
jgi:tripartite-type tricarboxylate transporter receptor subunit TctC